MQNEAKKAWKSWKFWFFATSSILTSWKVKKTLEVIKFSVGEFRHFVTLHFPTPLVFLGLIGLPHAYFAYFSSYGHVKAKKARFPLFLPLM